MSNKKYCLGIDTSNYTTSAAIVDEELNIVCDSRQILKVKKGERGLRQSQALFEHIENLANVIEGLNFKGSRDEIAAVAVSERPRPVEGSYMPVFRAGESHGRALAALMNLKYYGFSHQEGHVEAAKRSSAISPDSASSGFICLHLSGGTTEALICSENNESGGYNIEIVGKTLDVSFGQLIDRAGVKLGMDFPCGREMDFMIEFDEQDDSAKNPFCNIKVVEGNVNISGIDTQISRFIDENPDVPKGIVIKWLFQRVGEALGKMISQTRETAGIQDVVLAGGVASSKFIRKMLSGDPHLYFGEPVLCSDNAVGIAAMGMKKYLNEEMSE